jgi:hypothetical protein
VRKHFKKHEEFLDTFPSPFFGPIKTAKLIMAYASPGNSPEDKKQAENPNWIKMRVKSFDGTSESDLSLFDDHKKAQRWFQARIDKILGVDISKVCKDVAFVNLSAYRGDSTIWSEVACAPTTQAMRQWLREKICERNGPIVLIMRADDRWGFGKRPFQAKRKNLFVLDTTPAGLPKSNEKTKEARAVTKNALLAASKRLEAAQPTR